MAKNNAPFAKLNTMHHIGYGAGDAGGVVMLCLISYLERFSRNVLGVDPVIYAGILVVWNVWDAINDPLSLNRANSVADYLLSLGVSANQIKTVEGCGSKQPVADNSTKEGKAANRRVEITILE